MRRLTISVLFRVGLLGLLTWAVVIVLLSISPIWAFVGDRVTTFLAPPFVATGFVALLLGLLSLLAACIWAGGAFVHRRLRRLNGQGHR